MKTLLLAVATMVFFASTAAYAGSCGSTTPMPPGGVAYQDANNNWGNYQYSDNDDFRRANRKFKKNGRYELQTRSQWVPGATTQVWVPGVCHRPPFSPIQICARGHYETRTLPGRYEQVQEWVWVTHGGRFHGRHGRGR